jgi:hypothetical protein
VSIALTTVACLAAAALSTGCAGANPFLAAQFATTFLNVPRGGPPPTPIPPGDGDGDGDDAVLASVCDLTAGEQGINVSIANQAQQRVRFAITFGVSAGTGGFVCDTLTQDYVNAGYSDAFAPGSATTFAIGCDTLTLNSGNRLLIMKFGIEQLPEQLLQPNVGGDPGATLPTVQFRRRDNGDDTIPLPELIVFGNASVNFVCVGSDLCTQRGFNYASTNNLPIGKSPDALHIQGTLCQTGFGTAPEWRLDKTLNDGIVQTFQYPVGATIVATVLDRSGDSLTDPRNQVVWLVTDANGTTVHDTQP